MFYFVAKEDFEGHPSYMVNKTGHEISFKNMETHDPRISEAIQGYVRHGSR